MAHKDQTPRRETACAIGGGILLIDTTFGVPSTRTKPLLEAIKLAGFCYPDLCTAS